MHGGIKGIIKEMVMSAAYRQSSKTTEEKLEKDPYNRLLSRGARFRLSAEQIRDQSLAVSGLLENKNWRQECNATSAGWDLECGI